jgi:hypothetical protein
VAAVKEKMAASEGQGPFMQRFCALLKALKIDVNEVLRRHLHRPRPQQDPA